MERFSKIVNFAMLFTLIRLFCINFIIKVVLSSCPNDCSGHGHCNSFNICECYSKDYLSEVDYKDPNALFTYAGIDCSQELCHHYSDIPFSLHEEKISSLNRIPKIDDIGNNLQFNVIFEDYILNQRPFKGKYLDGASGQGLIENRLDNDIYSLSIPALAMNNYILRLNSSSIVRNSIDEFEVSTNGLNSFGCSLSLHQFLWNPFPESVTARIHQNLNNNVYDPHYFKANPSQDQSTTTRYYHFSDAIDELPETHRVVIIGSGEVLFVPSNFVVSLRSNHPTTMYRMCYLDGSNLSKFILRNYEHSIVNEGLFDMIDSLWSLTHDMTKTIPSLAISLESATEYNFTQSTIQAPAASAGSTNRRNRKKSSTSSLKEWQDSSRWSSLVTSLTLPLPGTVNVVTVDRIEAVLEWNSSFIPESSDQTIHGFNITVCEVAQYVDVKDLSCFMPSKCFYQQLYRKFDPQLHVDRIQFTESPTPGAKSITFRATVDHLQPDTNYITSVAVFYSNYQSMSSLPSEVFKTKTVSEPNKIGCIRSDACISATVDDIQLSTACYLNFLKPLDDGGDEILGYHIDYAITSMSTKRSDKLNWHYYGELKAFTVQSVADVSRIYINHLHSNTTYVFRLSAYNQYGSGPLSEISNPVHTLSRSLSSDERPTITSYHLRNHGSNETELLYLQVNTDDEKLVVRSTIRSSVKLVETDFPIWLSHWSSRSYDIKGICHWLDPFVLDYSNGNFDTIDITQKIVFIGRGKIPFIHKALQAQHAGSYGVVIVDDGNCNNYDQKCLPGSSRDLRQGFGRLDRSKEWSQIKIPVLFILRDMAETIASSISCEGYEEYVHRMEAGRDEL